MRGMPSDLLPGEPLCSPRATVLLESTIQLLRRLYMNDDWVQHINQHMLNRLQLINPLMREGQGKIGQLTCPNSKYIYKLFRHIFLYLKKLITRLVSRSVYNIEFFPIKYFLEKSFFKRLLCQLYFKG